MILSEWSLQGNFREVESEVIDKLDELMEKDNDGDNHTRDYFVSALRLLFSGPSVDPQLQEAVTTWLNSVDQFLKLLISLRDLPDGEEYQDDRVVSTLRLLNFLRSVGGRDTMYISYVHQLVASHVRSGDFTEAGLTLKLHASLYEWNRNSFVEPFVFGELELPRQSQFGRKESLYLQTLDYLGRGKAFELAIEVCKELEYQHQNTTFDYTRLAELLSHHSRLLESIVAEPQPYPHYFMVNYFGPFPLAVRGQRFVYRGSEWQKFGGFCDQLQNKHPQAKLIKSIILPDHVENGDELYIQVLAVQPEPDKSLPVFNPSVAKEIRTYYETSNVNVFSHSRPFNKSGRFGGERDIADVFIEKTFVTCQESFPTVLRRSEIKNTWVVEISSITSAVSDVRAKSVELEALEESYTTLSETGQELNTNPLSMALNGAVDAPMNGGVPAYRKAFFSPQFVAQNPDKSGEIDALRAAIEDQTRILARCIDLHGLVVPDAMTPFHLTIEQFFHKTFAEEISRIGIALPVGLGDEAPSALGVAAQRHREERARSVSAKATQSSPVRVTNFLSSSNYTNGSAERERQSSTQSRVSADARSFGSTNSSPGRRLSSIGSLAVGTGQLPRASNGSGGGGGGGDGRETSGGFLSPTSNSRPPTRSEGDLSDSGPLSWSPTLGKKDGSSLGRFSSLMRRKEKEPKRNGV